MAKATAGTIEIKRVIVDTESVVILDLSMDEAKWLSALMKHIGGHPSGLRKYQERINDALQEVIGEWNFSNGTLDRYRESIHFNDDSNEEQIVEFYE